MDAHINATLPLRAPTLGWCAVEFVERMAIEHVDHVFMNPMSSAKIDELIELLELPAGSRVLDVGAGNGELLRRLVRRWGCSGVGVDASLPCVTQFREANARTGLSDSIEVVHGDGALFEAPPSSFDAVFCLGAEWIWGGFEGTLEALAALTKPNGRVVIGSPHWRVDHPSLEYLEAMGLTREQFGSHADHASAGDALGLRFSYALMSSQDDWDLYEGLRTRALQRWLLQNLDHPDRDELDSNRDRDAYMRWGREQLGWGMYLFVKP
jgi:SAM-dependent methyltransferase